MAGDSDDTGSGKAYSKVPETGPYSKPLNITTHEHFFFVYFIVWKAFVKRGTASMQNDEALDVDNVIKFEVSLILELITPTHLTWL